MANKTSILLTEGQIDAIEAAEKRKRSAVAKWVAFEFVAVVAIALIAWHQWLQTEWFLQNGQKHFWDGIELVLMIVGISVLAVAVAMNVLVLRWVYKVS